MTSLGVLCFGVALVAGGGGDVSETRKPLVVCSTTQVADFARQVVGDRCDVRCILPAGADPHLYATRPEDARLVSQADLCVQNGLHLEGKDWMGTLARDANKRLVTCTQGVQPIELEANGEKVDDPHAWFSPRNAAIYVNNIVRAVSQLDPDGRESYEARASLYLGQLRELDGWIQKQVSQLPPNKRILVTSHDAFNYFCKAYGFQGRAPVGWSTGDEIGAGLTPQRRQQVVDSIRSFGVKAIFVETSVNPKLIREIASEAGVAIGGELYSDSMGEPGSAGETYIGMMRENVLTITQALK